MAAGEDIEVVRADVADRALLEGLFQFYIYDFSELEPAASPRFEPQADGRFAPYPDLDSYWREPSRTVLLIRRGGRPVGFVLLNAESHSGLALDHNVAEFFVMRKHRRGGVAAAAVRQMLAGRPGVWEAAIAERNLAARAFWPRAVASAPGVSDMEMLEGDRVLWTGPILRFRVAA